MKFKKITFVCPCYNHEKYVGSFLNSLIGQTDPNWELIIIDDCSTDNSVAQIKSFSDKRIHLITNSFNKGINANVSHGIQIAKTEIVSFVASDDILYPNYVETVLDTFDKYSNIGACYTPLNHMNTNGELLVSTTPLPATKSEAEIFADMFLNENLLPSPGMAFKRSVFEPYLPLDAGLIQYSDYQMHFFILFNTKIKMLDTPLVQYRISQTGTCARSPSVVLREDIETQKLMDNVVNLIGDSKRNFDRFFGKHPLIVENKIPSETIPFWLGRLALTSRNVAKQKWGLQTIMNFISTNEHVSLLNRLYGFCYGDYMKMAGTIVANMAQQPLDIKLNKYRKKAKKLKQIVILLIVLSVLLTGGLICK